MKPNKPNVKSPTCSWCGNTQLLADAYAEWDSSNQRWVIHCVFDEAFCNDCEGVTSIHWND